MKMKSDAGCFRVDLAGCRTDARGYDRTLRGHPGNQCNIELQPYLTYIHVVHVTDGRWLQIHGAAARVPDGGDPGG